MGWKAGSWLKNLRTWSHRARVTLGRSASFALGSELLLASWPCAGALTEALALPLGRPGTLPVPGSGPLRFEFIVFIYTYILMSQQDQALHPSAWLMGVPGGFVNGLAARAVAFEWDAKKMTFVMRLAGAKVLALSWIVAGARKVTLFVGWNKTRVGALKLGLRLWKMPWLVLE